MLAQLVDPDVARAVREQFPEIAEERRESRQYPAGALAANVVGARRLERRPTASSPAGSGLESSQDNLLAGSGRRAVVDTAEGSNAVIPGSTRFERPAVPGSDLQLTLDSDLQYTVQRQLADYVAATGRQAAVVGGRARRAHRRRCSRWPTRGRSTRATPGAPRPSSWATRRCRARSSRAR